MEHERPMELEARNYLYRAVPKSVANDPDKIDTLFKYRLIMGKKIDSYASHL